MSIYVDADAIAQWEKGEFDLISWLESRPNEVAFFPATVWQQLLYGKYAWEPARAQKRNRYLTEIALPVIGFLGKHADRAASLTAILKLQTIGFADFQIAATALERMELNFSPSTSATSVACQV